MAKVKFGPIVSEARNREGATIFSRNKYGPYTRSQPLPPAIWYPTLTQAVNEGAFADLMARWQHTLTDEQRLQWAEFALHFPRTKPVNGTRPLAPAQAFIRANLVSYYYNASFIDDPPANQEVQQPGPVTIPNLIAATDLVTLTTETADPTNQVLVIRATRPLSPGILNFARYLNVITYVDPTGPFPLDITTPYGDKYGPLVTGQRVGFEIFHANFTNGALSVPRITSKLTEAGVPPPPIIYDTTTTKTQAAASSLTWAHSVAAGSDRILVVGVSHQASPDRTITGITYNGVALTKAKESNFGSFYRVALWYLVAPDTGLHNVIVTFSGATTNATAGAISFQGVDHLAPIDATRSATQTSNLASLFHTTIADNAWIVDCVVWANGTYLDTPRIGQIERWNHAPGAFGAEASTKGPWHPPRLTWIQWRRSASAQWALVTLSLKPA